MKTGWTNNNININNTNTNKSQKKIIDLKTLTKHKNLKKTKSYCTKSKYTKIKFNNHTNLM